MVCRIRFRTPFDSPDCFRGLEDFSHIWVLWGFHRNPDLGFSPTVRPPRLGGNERTGVFASRSPFRPNSLGLSVVELLSVDIEGHRSSLATLGGDFVDQTPVFDIKPYVTWCDSIPDAISGFADQAPAPHLAVLWKETALRSIADPLTRAQVETVLALDPRPAFHDDPQRLYGFRFGDWNIQFRVAAGSLVITDASLALD